MRKVLELTGSQRSKKQYEYHTSPEVSVAVDKKALELVKGLPLYKISHELAKFGCALLMEREGKTVIIDPSTYALTLRNSYDEKRVS